MLNRSNLHKKVSDFWHLPSFHEKLLKIYFVVKPLKKDLNKRFRNFKHSFLLILDTDLIFYRDRLSRSWFMIHNEVLNFYGWILCYHESRQDKKIKVIGIINGSVTFNSDLQKTWSNLSINLTKVFDFID